METMVASMEIFNLTKQFPVEKNTVSRQDAKSQRENILTENDVAKIVADAAFKVHTALGPGLLESVYEVVLAHEFEKRGFSVDRQKPIIVEYEGLEN